MSKELTSVYTTNVAHVNEQWGQDKVDLLKRTICKGATNDELQLFLGVCKRTQLDPFTNQIYAVKRWDSTERKEVMKPQVSIDGARIVAERSGQYIGQEGPFWCGADGVWKEVWLDNDTMPSACKVVVFKRGSEKGFPAVAHWDEYVAKKKDGTITHMWETKPALMLAKCAEMLALRKAFPNDLSSLYSSEEMGQETPPVIAHHRTEAHAEVPAEKPALSAQISERVLADVAMHKQNEAAKFKIGMDQMPSGFAKEENSMVKLAADLDAQIVEDRADWVIPSGSLEGTKLSDKTDAFWGKYLLDLEGKTDGMPQQFKPAAILISKKLREYLGE